MTIILYISARKALAWGAHGDELVCYLHEKAGGPSEVGERVGGAWGGGWGKEGGEHPSQYHLVMSVT